MAKSTGTPCPICEDPSRHRIENLYLEGDMRAIEAQHRYTRHEVEAHMGHVADPEVVRIVSGLAGATAVAARLRQLEQTAGAILEVAITGAEIRLPDGSTVWQPPDLKLALQAAREVRATLVEVAKMSPALDSQQSTAVERTDLDQRIEDYLSGRSHEEARAAAAEAADEGQDAHPSSTGRGERELRADHAPLALPPG